MNPGGMDLRQRAAEAGAALNNGDAAGALAGFRAILAAGGEDASIWYGVALAATALDDLAARAEAIAKGLKLEPHNPRLLILKADDYALAGNDRAAAAHYNIVLRMIPDGAQLPPDLEKAVARARLKCSQYAGEYADKLTERLAAKGVTFGEESDRFSRSFEVLTGKRQIYYQEPKVYNFPELPQIQFYDRELFPWMDRVEAATDDIRAELIEVLRDDAAFTPYIEGKKDRPENDVHNLLNNPAWSAFYLWKNGRPVEENVARCPKTMAALADAPIPQIRHRSPSILFSLMKPGMHIPPHTGLVNTRLICHLPVILPEGCEFRVGNETRKWEMGKAWAFDDTINHEAWNRSSETRVILLWEIWRPELTLREREQVTALFEALEDEDGKRPDWDI